MGLGVLRVPFYDQRELRYFFWGRMWGVGEFGGGNLYDRFFLIIGFERAMD